MKLRTFNATNIQKGTKNLKPFIYINAVSGVISMNRGACDMLGVREGDGVQMPQDEDDPENWFIEKSKKDGFILRGNGNKTAMMFNCSGLVRQICKSMGYTGRGARIHIGEEVTFGKLTMFTLITAPLKNSDNQ